MCITSPWKRESPESWRRQAGFIVFEGIDGCGKSTQAAMLAEKLRESGIPVLLTAEPSSGPVGRAIRSLGVRPDLREEVRLFTEDRRHHVSNVIEPALEKGCTVICDRYVYSSVAYQGARGADIRQIMSANSSFALKPHVVILVEIDIDVAISRIASGRSGRFSPFEVRESLEAVDRIYRGLSDPVIRRLDGSNSPQQIHQDILRTIADLQPFHALAHKGQLLDDQ